MLTLNLHEAHTGIFLQMLSNDTQNLIGTAYAATNRFLFTSYTDDGRLLDIPRLIRKADEEMIYNGNPNLLSFGAKTELMLSMFHNLLPDAPVPTKPSRKQTLPGDGDAENIPRVA